MPPLYQRKNTNIIYNWSYMKWFVSKTPLFDSGFMCCALNLLNVKHWKIVWCCFVTVSHRCVCVYVFSQVINKCNKIFSSDYHKLVSVLCVKNWLGCFQMRTHFRPNHKLDRFRGEYYLHEQHLKSRSINLFEEKYSALNLNKSS